MKDTNFLDSIDASFVVNDTVIPNWVDNGYPCFYVPARLLGMSWFAKIYAEMYRESRERFFEHFMGCMKVRNWEYRTIENLVLIDWSVKPDGIGIESRESY